MAGAAKRWREVILAAAKTWENLQKFEMLGGAIGTAQEFDIGDGAGSFALKVEHGTLLFTCARTDATDFAAFAHHATSAAAALGFVGPAFAGIALAHQQGAQALTVTGGKLDNESLDKHATGQRRAQALTVTEEKLDEENGLKHATGWRGAQAPTVTDEHLDGEHAENHTTGRPIAQALSPAFSSASMPSPVAGKAAGADVRERPRGQARAYGARRQAWHGARRSSRGSTWPTKSWHAEKHAAGKRGAQALLPAFSSASALSAEHAESPTSGHEGAQAPMVLDARGKEEFAWWVDVNYELASLSVMPFDTRATGQRGAQAFAKLYGMQVRGDGPSFALFDLEARLREEFGVLAAAQAQQFGTHCSDFVDFEAGLREEFAALAAGQAQKLATHRSETRSDLAALHDAMRFELDRATDGQASELADLSAMVRRVEDNLQQEIGDCVKGADTQPNKL